MPLSLSSDDEDSPDDVEQRLRNRLADLEGRLEDQQKVRQMREHIQHLRNKHELELEKAELKADQRVEEVKDKARDAVQKARRKVKRERARREKLEEAVLELAEALDDVDEARQALEDAGLDARLAPRSPSADAEEEPRAFLRDLVARTRDVESQLERVDGAIGDGELGEPTTDVAVLEERVADLLTNPEVRSKAKTVAEKAQMFAEDPGKSQYYREMVLPYADGIRQVAEAHPRANVVQGARLALDVVEEAFRTSRTYLLRRSDALDDHEIDVDVLVERVEEDPADAVDRLEAALNTARGLGPVDFFQNLADDVARRVDRGDDGAAVAAWILSDVTVEVLEDETVRTWLDGQR